MACWTRSITIPANTLEASPKVEELLVKERFVTTIEIDFPGGCCGYVKLRIYYGIRKKWPDNPGGYFAADDYTIVFPVYKDLPEARTTLRLTGWSPGTSYDHTLTVRVNTQSKEYLPSRSLFQKIYDLFSKIF